MRRLLLRRIYYDAHQMSAGSVLLDYGCGDGWYLDHIRNQSIIRLGYEQNQTLAQLLSDRLKIRVYHDAERLESEWAGRIDCITLHFVLEHLTDLKGTFAHLARLLKPCGHIYAVLPNINSLEFQLFKSRWHGLDAPRHIVFPDADTLAPVLSPQQLEVIEDRFVRFPNTFAGSVAIRLGGRFLKPLFLMCLPLGMLWCAFDSSGNRALEMRKHV
jgi:SAM-dependent methyltransferase